MMLRLFAFLLAACAVAACNETPRQAEFNDQDVVLGKLQLVTNARVGLAYVDPNADLSKYSKVMLDPLDLRKTEIVQPDRSTSAVSRKPWVLNEQDIQRIQAAFREVFTSELEETGDYEVVSSPGPDVLRITASVDRIAPTAAKDDMSRGTGRTRVYTENAGSMSISFGFSDSESGEVWALVRDARRGTPVWSQNNAVTNMSDVRFMFRHWARMLRARLDIAHGY